MKLFGVILTVITFGFIGFIATIITLLTRDGAFYSKLIPVVTTGIIVMIILAIYGQLKKRVVKRSVVIFFALLIISVAAYEGYQMYVKSLEVVSTQDVDLSTYQPFSNNTKAVSLDEFSTYKIENKLPKLDGATALYPVYASFVQAVYPEKEYPLYPLDNSEVVSSQTDEAFNRLINGEVDMVFMAHPSETQMKMAESKVGDLELTPIGREAFVFFVHKDNPVNTLTVEQIQGIYAGEITNWSEVDGDDEAIRAFQRPEGSGSQTALINMMDGTPLMDPPSEDIVSAMGGIIRETSNYQNRTNAIGYSFRHFSQEMVVDGKIKHIAIEGLSPTKENIQNDSYPIIGEFYAITAGSENPHLDAFVEWILSDQGQKIIDLTGYVPIK
ncbi:substrate-binding domain-containing protein [Aquibacillus koreensis]|uniref:Substrate-binding domain-containing protein n=1 Tax=Aquibacillus koreensis TaxID=279446 RepID=A0A9X4AK35_9BACI|nr:substrate-binding domain-containing protein [Aquibacillus koreensis]MCT2535242.1 substrate-binding domain-containing protein [Aquibacillus koreensis]MDC3422857.1 substrate-binding domain-containing protein [Aquibacillus koreensis]